MATIHNEGTGNEYMRILNTHTIGYLTVSKKDTDGVKIVVALWEDAARITISPAQVQELINYLQKQLK